MDASRSGETLDDGENHSSSELASVSIEKSDILELWLDVQVRTVFHPELEPFLRFRRDRYKSLLAALTLDEHVALLTVHITELEIDEFGNAQTTAVKHFDDSAIAVPFVRAKVYLCNHSIDFLDGKHIGQVKLFLRHSEEFAGVRLNIVMIE